MHTAYAAYAVEMEALLTRAARQGRLDPYELLDTYLELAPTAHPLVKNARQLDVTALTNALCTLPREFLTAPQVLVVPRLSAYSHTPLVSRSFLAGRLGDGTVLIEARYGLRSLIGLAASLCTIAHELDKARSLHAPDDPIDTTPCATETAGDDTVDIEPLVHIGHYATDTTATSPTNDGCADNEATDSPSDDELALLAFALGVDETRLRVADEQSEGRLLAVLAFHWELPPIALHAELDVRAVNARAVARVERIVTSLAELGLMGRDLHLWIGGPSITDCLSPYSRELRDAVLAWAATHGGQIGSDIDLHRAISEDILYALVADFLASDPGLEDERNEADRTVGIQRCVTEGARYDVIDLRRVDPNVSDARLGEWETSEEAPVLLRVAPDLEDSQGGGLSRLVALLASKLKSVTLALEGTALGHSPGTVLLPAAAVRWEGEWPVMLARATPMSPAELSGAVEAIVQGGVVLSVPRAELLSTAHVLELGQLYRLHAIDVGSAAMVNALCTQMLAGVLDLRTQLRWVVVAANYLASGRPDVTTQRTLSALSVLELRRLLKKPEPVAPIVEPTKPQKPRAPPSGRTVRLKA